jgi:hypothetical protein|nr:MAG TPA: hypothetical protein [Caudoviricetes sp.]DAX75404.1 MAG TPA: hypothetical protein [Caudoviricetes sp.]
MKGNEGIRRMFERRLQEAAETVFYGEVSAVNEGSRTCTVVMEDIPYENVLLYAVENTELKGQVLIPRIGSTVLVERIANDRYFVAMFSEVAKVLLTIGENTIVEVSEECVRIQSGEKTTVTADAEKCLLQVGESVVKATEKGLTFIKGGAGLKKTLEELIDAITKLTVTTGVGPSGVPINAADFIKIKQGLNDYLEG